MFSGKRLWGVRVEAEVVRERVRKRQSGQVLFRQHVQDGRVLGRLQNQVQGLPETISGEDRHDDAVHIRRRRHTRTGREHRQSEPQRRHAEFHQSNQISI